MKKPLLLNYCGSSFCRIHTGHLLFIVIINLLLASGSLFAQNRVKSHGSLGLRVSSTISANRFGAIYAPSVFYKSKRNLFAAGIMVQKQDPHFCGFQGNYEYTILDGNSGDCYLRWLELFAFATAGYYNQAQLGHTVCEEERTENPDFKENLDDKKFKALEAYAGFGLRVTFLKNFKWFSCIGIGGYDVLNAPQGMYYNTHAVGMLMRTGISYQFSKINKTHF
ncbi:MAG: hypothetical protein JWP12_2075 [Bacteroidetes bacterium]|nr:hypothetical protein [Bacteroidota bacterium]